MSWIDLGVLWMVYGWFMDGLWMVHGWFLGGFWMVYFMEFSLLCFEQMVYGVYGWFMDGKCH